MRKGRNRHPSTALHSLLNASVNVMAACHSIWTRIWALSRNQSSLKPFFLEVSFLNLKTKTRKRPKTLKDSNY